MGSDMELDPTIDMESWKKISALSRECDQWRERAERAEAALARMEYVGEADAAALGYDRPGWRLAWVPADGETP